MKEYTRAIKEHNSQKFANLCAQKPTGRSDVVAPDVFKRAFEAFNNAEDRYITEHYRILESLVKYFGESSKLYSPQDIGYISGYINVFNEPENKKKHKGFDIEKYNAQLARYNEKRSLRLVYKDVDRALQRELIYKIKYPENQTFIKKLLSVFVKIERKEIEQRFVKRFDDVVNEITVEILRKNQDMNEVEVRAIAYERTLLQMKKYFKFTQAEVDRALEDRAKTHTKIESLDQFLKLESGYNVEDLTLKIFVGALRKEQYNQHNVDEYFKGIQGAEKYASHKGTLDGLKFFEKALKSHLMLVAQMNKSNAVSGVKTALCQPDSVVGYNAQLEEVQGKINAEELRRHDAMKVKPKNRLTDYEIRAIKAYQNLGANPTQADKDLVASFFEKISGDKNFNQRLSVICKNEARYAKELEKNRALKNGVVTYESLGIVTGILEDIRSFTYRTLDLDAMVALGNKVHNIEDCIKNDREIKPEEKLTLDEIGKSYRISKLMVLKNLEEFGVLKDDSELKRAYDGNKSIAIVIDAIDKEINYQPGELLLEDAMKYHDVQQHALLPLFHKIRDIVTTYTHASIYLGKSQLSHVGDYDLTHEEVGGLRKLTVESFIVKPEKLISADMKKALCAAYGKNEDEIAEIISQMYKQETANLHNQLHTQHDKLEEAEKIWNNKNKGENSGYSDFIPFAHKAKTAMDVDGKVEKMEVRDWAKAALAGKEDLVSRIKDPKTGKFIICSEFAAKMTAITLMAVEEELVNKLKEQDPTFEPPKEGLIKMPFHRNEDLGKVHPQRLVKILQKAGAIEAVDNSAAIEKFTRGR